MDVHRTFCLIIGASMLSFLQTSAFANPLTSASSPVVVSTADTAAQKAATPAKGMPEAPSIAATLSGVPEISRELKRIDERLAMLGRSLACVDASLKRVGALTGPEALQTSVARATELFLARTCADPKNRS
jgi:hypothetical protein